MKKILLGLLTSGMILGSVGVFADIVPVSKYTIHFNYGAKDHNTVLQVNDVTDKTAIFHCSLSTNVVGAESGGVLITKPFNAKGKNAILDVAQNNMDIPKLVTWIGQGAPVELDAHIIPDFSNPKVAIMHMSFTRVGTSSKDLDLVSSTVTIPSWLPDNVYLIDSNNHLGIQAAFCSTH